MENCCKTKQRSEEQKKKIVTHLNRINGQISGIKKMVEEDRYCDDVLIQLSAVNNSIKSLANYILDDHMHSCLVEHIKKGEYDIIDEIVQLFRRFQ